MTMKRIPVMGPHWVDQLLFIGLIFLLSWVIPQASHGFFLFLRRFAFVIAFAGVVGIVQYVLDLTYPDLETGLSEFNLAGSKKVGWFHKYALVVTDEGGLYVPLSLWSTMKPGIRYHFRYRRRTRVVNNATVYKEPDRHETQPHNYVSSIQDNQVVIRQVTPAIASVIIAHEGHKLGSEDEESWVVNAADEQALTKLLSVLQEADVLFVGGPTGWPPAAVVDDLREQGVLHGAFQEVVWHGDGRWSVTER